MFFAIGFSFRPREMLTEISFPSNEITGKLINFCVDRAAVQSAIVTEWPEDPAAAADLFPLLANDPGQFIVFLVCFCNIVSGFMEDSYQVYRRTYFS